MAIVLINSTVNCHCKLDSDDFYKVKNYNILKKFDGCRLWANVNDYDQPTLANFIPKIEFF